MSTQDLDHPGAEPERYELDAPAPYHFKTGRRGFIRQISGGILVICLVPALAQETGGPAGGRRGGRGNRAPQEIGAWIHIGEDGAVTAFTGKVEVGQNIRTELTQVVAEELRTPVASITLVMGDTDLTPFDAGTFGSRTTPDMVPQLRRAAASAREALIDLAAEQQKVERTAVKVEGGKLIIAPTGRSLGFGEVTHGSKLLKTVTNDAAETPATKWSVAGTAVPKVDGADFVTGRHRYASDIKRPGMLHGAVVRPAMLGGRLVTVDTKEAEAMAGVTVVHDGQFIGVAAPDSLRARRATQAIHAEWKAEPQISDRDLYKHLRGAAEPPAGAPRSTAADGTETLRSTYTVAYIAHAPLEPRAAVAEWSDGKLTVWTGTQRPFGVRGDLAQAFGIGEDKVRVIVPDTGSAYGGKHRNEAAIEAARLSKAAGKPVKLVWTREEEFTWAYFRPAGVIDVAASVGKDGHLTSWEFHNYNSGGSALRTPYDVPDPKTEFHNSSSPLAQGSYRGLAATANHFARESHMDDLAHAVGIDPLEFRLRNLKDARLEAVLRAVAKGFDWGKEKPTENRGFGIAGGTEKGAYVATGAEISIDAKGVVKVVRVVQAFECGAVLNPDGLRNQNEGAIMMGLGGALFEAIRFADGKITNPHFSEYRVPRFSDAPRMEIILLDRRDARSDGAGETPIVTIAPAIGNAIFSATGRRLTSMPMAL